MLCCLSLYIYLFLSLVGSNNWQAIQLMDPQFAGKPIATPFSHRTDIDRMPETPTRRAHHRRAQSETFFRFPDDLLLDDVVSDFNLEIPSLSSDADNVPMAVDCSKSESSNGCAADRFRSKPSPAGPMSHFRSLSVDSDFFDGLGFSPAGDGDEKSAGEKRVRHHRHSNSMDGSTSLFDSEVWAKKAMAPDRLAELALMDPKRAKRILANRQSAARSKERKIRYTSELERKVQTLQTEATTLSAQVTMLQRDTGGLTTENKELKLRLQALEEQAGLRDALNEALKEEVQRLKITASQISAASGNPYSRSVLPPHFSANPQAFHQYATSQNQPNMLQSSSLSSASAAANNPTSGQPQRSFSGYNQRV